METQMIRKVYPVLADTEEEAIAILTQQIPDGRMAQPEELAQAGLWFLLDAPTHINGQVLMVDGAQAAS
jgi:NAD(P)-dependent dehydrogenase (short-subunit alcohol dehydrogenase family)